MNAPALPPITDAELRWAYRLSRLAREGITFDQACAAPCLRAALELGVHMRRRRRADSAGRSAAGAGIERSHPEFSSTHQP